MLIFNNFYPNIDHKLVLALVLVLNSCYFEKKLLFSQKGKSKTKRSGACLCMFCKEDVNNQIQCGDVKQRSIIGGLRMI